MCAQNDLNTSFVSFRIGGIRVQTAIQHIGDTSLVLATKFNSSGFGRCVLVTPETTEVSDISVLNGKNAVGTLPPLSYVHSTESLSIIYEGLIPGRTYIAYCAQRYTLSQPLWVNTKKNSQHFCFFDLLKICSNYSFLFKCWHGEVFYSHSNTPSLSLHTISQITGRRQWGCLYSCVSFE